MVFAFFVCWAPFHAQRLGYVYFKESIIFRTINEYLYYVSGFLYYLSGNKLCIRTRFIPGSKVLYVTATVNPILYNLMSLKYRHAFKQTLCGGRGRSRGRRRRGRNANRSYTFRSTTRSGRGKSSLKKHTFQYRITCNTLMHTRTKILMLCRQFLGLYKKKLQMSHHLCLQKNPRFLYCLLI